MKVLTIKNIQSYLHSNTRNKLLFYRGKIYDVEYLNVGIELSKLIRPFLNKRHFSLKAMNILDKLLQSYIIKHSDLGNVLALSNMGILFEEELQIDFFALLDRYSKNSGLILDWQGEIEDGKLYFLEKKNGIQIDIKDLSHLVLIDEE